MIDRPEAGPGFLRAVARHLARRRTVTAELHVVGPGFITLEVAARLWVVQRIAATTLRARARLVSSTAGTGSGTRSRS